MLPGCPDLGRPLVVSGQLTSWPCSTWTPASLAQVHTAKLRLRIGRRSVSCVQYEGDCVYEEATLSDFVDWLEGSRPPNSENPLARYPSDEYWCYADYKYMRDVFAEQPHILQAVDWSVFGLQSRTGQQSTLWLGSAGAYTVCHYDTYGWNLVAQIAGRKKWVLFPPSQSQCLYPTRIPYEESSVFSEVHVTAPDLDKHPRFEHCRPTVVILEPGETLYVPRHWWHYVECLETAISVNTWVDTPADTEERLREAVTRTLTCGTLQDVTSDWLNPTEADHDMTENFDLLSVSLHATMEQTASQLSTDPELTAFRETITRPGVSVRVCEASTYSRFRKQYEACSNLSGGVDGKASDGHHCEGGTKRDLHGECGTMTNKKHKADGNQGVVSTGDVKGVLNSSETFSNTRSILINAMNQGSEGDTINRDSTGQESSINKQNCQNSDSDQCDSDTTGFGLSLKSTGENNVNPRSVGEGLNSPFLGAGCTSAQEGDSLATRDSFVNKPRTRPAFSVEDMVNCFVDRDVVELVCKKLKQKYREKKT